MEVIIGVGCRWRHEGLVDLHGKVVDAEVAVEADLEDEGVEDGVVHGGDVEMEHLEMEALEKGDDPDGRGAPRERARSTLAPEILASTSAMGELQQAASSATSCSCCLFSSLGEMEDELPALLPAAAVGEQEVMRERGLGVGLGLPPPEADIDAGEIRCACGCCLRFFWASSDCSSVCSSLMKSMAPPMIDAWSPCMHAPYYYIFVYHFHFHFH
ncbi:hypothetical protein OsI_21250 [Oryza sativa Indica Group]|uniref:Uncharacterized protein n=1 Tax=Oryza sativa subsp. indica TaxID=39946 RepID=B8AXI6_ORYSI|nr:hypothetical protein OsI_21250 [Oryza sativa Indica Group]